jgi:glyoxylase-like metal-dependent hydrolase (beta-lactamase superfamily II)
VAESGAVERLTRVTRFGMVNSYLVAEDDGFTVVDTMLPFSAKVVVRAAERGGAPIVRIVLTHAHADHVGSLDDLVRMVPDAEVIISAREARLLDKDKTMDPGEPEAKLRGSYPGAKTKPARTVAEGDRVGSLEVVSAPGHTPGHVALLDTRDRALICGDAFTTLGGVETTARVNRRFPLPTMSTWHRPTELESARRLRALEPSRLAPGHGRVVDAPLEAMDAAIRRAERG